MATLDELITKYTLDDKDYAKGAQGVIGWTHKTSDAIQHLGMNVLDHLTGAFRSLFNPITALIGGAGLLGLAKGAVDAAVHFEYLQRTLAGVTGSAQRAANVLAFVQKLAAPSVFTRDELAEAATRLEAFGLMTERYLPSMEKLGTIFGGSSTNLMEYVDALGRIKGGMTGRGFEVLERAGMSKDQFKALGLQFTKEGELISPINQALDAIRALIQKKFGALDLATTAKAKMASFMDSMRQAAEQVGRPILDVLVPAMEKVTGFVSYLVESGAIESAISGITKLMSGKDLGDGLVSMVGYLVASLKQIPNIMNWVGLKISEVFSWLRDNGLEMAKILLSVFAFEKVAMGLQFLVGAWRAVQAAALAVGIAEEFAESAATGFVGTVALIAAGAAAYLAISKAVDAMVGDFGDIQMGGIPIMKNIQRDHDKFLAGFKASITGPVTAPQADMGKEGTTAAGQTTSLLNQIEQHTKQTAQNTADFATHALGGGNLGKIGVTKAELHTIKHGGRDFNVNVQGGELSSAIRSMMYDALRQLRAEGAF